MGRPILRREEIPVAPGGSSPVVDQSILVDGAEYRMTAVSMGNPHAVIFTGEIASVPLDQLGPKVEHHPLFPARTNAHFVQVHSRGEITMRTWERGAGATLACGTGACASVVACVLNDKTDRRVLAHLPGGDLRIEWAPDDHVYMTGPAAEVFEGEIDLGIRAAAPV
jgi:diaminopimelate epimerase